MPSTTTATAEKLKASPALELLPARLRESVALLADRVDAELLARAYRFSEKAHKGQKRASGEKYVAHCVEVAKIVADLHLDTASIAAGLIHDVVEDTEATLDEVQQEFGDEIARIVDGVTKIGKVQFRSTTEQQVENYRKLLLSMAQDARVILIKLADRLHNMRTLDHLRPEKRKRIALETREIYGPLAHRLGMAQIRWELEDLSFKHLEAEAYKDLAKKVAERRKEREEQIEALRRPLERELKKAGIPVEVYGRPKHLWSIHRKISSRGKPYEEIYDLLAIRVVTDSIANCYHALGVIHNKWTPLQERFHDFIATPKSNMYRSLHTTIFGPGGRLYEIQIRTQEMHRTAEYGIAAHWRYKEGLKTAPKEGPRAADDEVDDTLSWFRQVLEWQQDTREPEEFMEFLRIDLFQDEIFVFTPKGDVKQLPKGATPIDFAFAVHTEVGLRCAGAKVNGRIVPLAKELRNGDTVEIVTDARHRPSRDWLAFVKTARARQKIRQWIKQEEFQSSVALGKELLDRELKKARKEKPSEEQMTKTAQAFNLPDFDYVLAALGRGDLGPSSILKELFDGDGEGAPGTTTTTMATKTVTAFERLVERVRGSAKGVRIQGMDNMMVRYSQCCQPVPGDDVIGYITRGRGISIHRIDCPNVLNLADHPERRVEIEWEAEQGERFFVRLVVEGDDRRGLLSDIATAITQTGTNITQADIHAVEGGMTGSFVVEVEDLTHLKKVMKAIRRVSGVISVERREAIAQAEIEA
ncbi:MAG: bifunctional (p)ppGpp synthetase/guanosine-3',5'-bis(diphosphate) 3'-pyrophosphohydrolase [Gemmatimonadetes bacterium]|nr:bifunctional (p)ppGpp synthetase/guanosine-3',5'-bis(diphosphate) 3'-pyrophosphohydrolase [Gemmatimonadota bacterium]